MIESTNHRLASFSVSSQKMDNRDVIRLDFYSSDVSKFIILVSSISLFSFLFSSTEIRRFSLRKFYYSLSFLYLSTRQFWCISTALLFISSVNSLIAVVTALDTATDTMLANPGQQISSYLHDYPAHTSALPPHEIDGYIRKLPATFAVIKTFHSGAMECAIGMNFNFSSI